MASKKITGKELRKIGYPEGKAIGVAIRVMEQHFKGKSRQHKLDLLKRVAEMPAFYREHETLGMVATALIVQTTQNKKVGLRKNRLSYKTYGPEGIEQGAMEQMEVAMKLPVTVAGALMPDAHRGYGLPIGGVLATKNAVIPYGVGVDIGCRMCLTLYDMPVSRLKQESDKLSKILTDNTRFGRSVFNKRIAHEVLDRDEFREIQVVRELKDTAWKQIGSSGGGNHFVEFGEVELLDLDNEFELPVGKYLGLLSHSGSRGLGANIARYYTQLAKQLCKLPDEARHLAWLSLDSHEGAEYWLAMNLAGDYASACHHQIHERIAVALGEKALARVENHHNFAWKEKGAQGEEIIVHRKGATPAGKGVLGIIPGSMSSPGFIVRGKGEAEAINSAAHGAGRLMSRTKAKKMLSKQAVKAHLQAAGVKLLGAGLDEAPMAYKNIHQVMARQQELVEVVGQFMPKIVRMCGEKGYFEVD